MQPALVQPDSVPVQPDPVPVQPDPIPVQLGHAPVQTDPVPVQPDPVPVQPHPIPGPVPVQPDPVPVQPDPIPVQPGHAPMQPGPVPVGGVFPGSVGAGVSESSGSAGASVGCHLVLLEVVVECSPAPVVLGYAHPLAPVGLGQKPSVRGTLPSPTSFFGYDIHILTF